VTEPQDEALALSRLAEYFVEMDRDYLATAAARILGESFGDDPNAMIARATVFHRAQDRAAFSRELLRLVQRHADDAGHLAWDRRVQRAVVFALGGRHDLARAEIAACTDTLSAENLQELTALQVFHYLKLADAYGVALPQPGLRRRAEALCAEYSPTGGRPVSPRK
jgi:hypothetical protein